MFDTLAVLTRDYLSQYTVQGFLLAPPIPSCTPVSDPSGATEVKQESSLFKRNFNSFKNNFLTRGRLSTSHTPTGWTSGHVSALGTPVLSPLTLPVKHPLESSRTHSQTHSPTSSQTNRNESISFLSFLKKFDYYDYYGYKRWASPGLSRPTPGATHPSLASASSSWFTSTRDPSPALSPQPSPLSWDLFSAPHSCSSSPQYSSVTSSTQQEIGSTQKKHTRARSLFTSLGSLSSFGGSISSKSQSGPVGSSSPYHSSSPGSLKDRDRELPPLPQPVKTGNNNGNPPQHTRSVSSTSALIGKMFKRK